MSIIDRKAATAAYKERKIVAGIYAVRCAATGAVWVGRTPNIDTVQNRLWFSLRHGSSTNRAIQSAWATHGEAGLAFETLERLPEEELASVAEAFSRGRLAHWRSTLDAEST